MDLSVIASYGLSDDDKKELSSVKNSQVEFGYLTDVTIKIPMMLSEFFKEQGYFNLRTCIWKISKSR